MSQLPPCCIIPVVQARVQATAASASDPRWRGERGERARDARDARDGPPDQMATDNKISPSGSRVEAAPRRSVQCAPSNLSRANIPAEAILTPAHTTPLQSPGK